MWWQVSATLVSSFMIKCVKLKKKWGKDNGRISMQYPHFYLNESISFLATMKAEVDIKFRYRVVQCWLKQNQKNTKKREEKTPRKKLIYNTYSDKVCQWLTTGWWFSPGTPVSSTNKTNRHDITEILLKMSLNIIKNPQLKYIFIYLYKKTKNNKIT